MIRIATTFMLTLLLAALPASAIDFLGVELCQGSADTQVKFSPGSSLVLESVEIGDSGGLIMLLSARSGKVMNHVDTISVSVLKAGQERAFRDAIRCTGYVSEMVAETRLQFAGGF
jgi:hypothetical protein